MAAFTDGAGLGETSPIQAHRAALESLESGTASREQAHGEALAKADLTKLRFALRRRVENLDADNAIRVSREFTRRGIPPCFRGLPVTDDPWWHPATDEVNFMLLLADLEWLAVRYPGHKGKWQRAQSALDPGKREAGAKYLHWDGQREPGAIAIALGLSVDQQRELAYVQFLNVRRWVEKLHDRLPFAESAIRRDVESRPWKSKAPKEDTIRRRLDLWHCAELANWKPQRTADFYEMLTGKGITRGIVAVQLVKLPKVRQSPIISVSNRVPP